MTKKKLGIIIGVGQGLGFSLTLKFARKGFKMAMIARRQKALDTFAERLSGEGLEAVGYTADVSDFDQLKATLERICEDHGEPDLLLYNVSILNPAPPTKIDIDGFLKDFRVNVAGLLVAAQTLVPRMENRKDAAILVTGGGLALNPFYEYASLAVGKAGVRSLTHSLAQEMKSSGIRVGTVIVNGMIEKGTRFDPDTIAEEFWKFYKDDQRKLEKEMIYS